MLNTRVSKEIKSLAKGFAWLDVIWSELCTRQVPRREQRNQLNKIFAFNQDLFCYEIEASMTREENQLPLQ